MDALDDRHPLLTRLPAAFLLSAWALLAAAAPAAAVARPPGYQFVTPLPHSTLVNRRTDVILREGGPIAASTVNPSKVVVTGDRSGRHSGALVLSADQRTLIFKPDRPFEWGETVSVRLVPGIRTVAGRDLPPLDYAFTVAPSDPLPLRDLRLDAMVAQAAALAPRPVAPARAGDRTLDGGLPAGYLPMTVMQSDHPDPGGVFMNPFTSNFRANRGRLVILDNRGQPLFFRSWPTFVFDFKRQPNGLLTFFTLPATYIAMDSTYTAVDSFKTGNGFDADEHDLQLLPDGHALLMAYDLEAVGMDTVVAGGDPDAHVFGLIIQELDASKNVVFQWRSWDHFQITDFVECTGSLTDSIIDYVHANAIELDADGNLLLSSRHMNEITKIDRQTGDILWRLGLNAKNNEFTFLDDPRGFSHQHDIRRQPNGHITLFDNGNCLQPPPFYSRAVEYELDEVAKTARLVWEFRNTPDQFGGFMGNQQRRENGGITIGWGGVFGNPKVTELHADGTKAFEIGFSSPVAWTYRAFRFPWQTTAFVTDSESVNFGGVPVHEVASRPLWITNRLATPLDVNQFISTDPQFSILGASPGPILPGDSAMVTVQFLPDSLGPIAGDLYVRAVSDTDLIARVVPLRGTGTGQALSIDDVIQLEGVAGGGPTPFGFTVRLAEPATEEVTFDYATEDSTATVADNDYVPVTGSASIAVGDSSVLIAVDVVADDQPEAEEVFGLRLSNVTHAVVVRGRGRGVIQYDEPGVGVGDFDPPSLTFALGPARPNPARGRVDLEYVLPVAGRVSLGIFDVRGRRVASLVDGVMPAGRNVASWRPPDRAGGVYFISLRSGHRTIARKFVLAR